MNNIDLTLKEIFTSTSLTKSQKVLHAEKMLTEQLDIETTHPELYFKLAVVVLEEPEVDFLQSIECMEKILTYDKTNIEAAIYLSWLQYLNRGYVNASTLTVLDKLLANVEMDSLSLSLIYLAKSWSDEIDEKQYHLFLKKSVESNDTYVDNFLELANFYRNRGESDKEKSFIRKALKNVEKIYLVDESFDIATVKPYLGDCFKGMIDVPTNYVPTYHTLKKESILRTVLASNAVKSMLERLTDSDQWEVLL
ncbi:tetratricopeptide repeat protein [Sporosarcina soli]|uniref:Tetratricopeptide repeat protein n=1 Tax=Sporosarcina soli TaxID=334736 RepID=A0ABW0THW0_9BACL